MTCQPTGVLLLCFVICAWAVYTNSCLTLDNCIMIAP